VTALSDRHYQAAGFARDGMAGTIATRHCPLDQLSVAPVTAIDPYLDGYLASSSGWPARAGGGETLHEF
jgi:hypothetical protein